MTSTNRLFAVRGAVCCENTHDSVSTQVTRLYNELMINNSIFEESIVSILFSVTSDLTILNPATALRNAGLALTVPLFASAEPYIEGYLPYVIRIMITYYGEKKPIPMYLNGAEVLRPDLGSTISRID